VSRFEELIPDLLLQARGCPRSVLVREIRRCAIDLFESTLIWRESHDPIYTIAGVTEYDLDPPKDGAIASVVSVSGESGKELEWEQRIPEVVELCTTPDRREKIKLVMAIKPSRKARGLPDSMMSIVERALLHGTLASLLMIPDQSWSNPSIGVEKQRRYKDEIRRLRVRAARKMSNSPLTVQIRGFT